MTRIRTNKKGDGFCFWPLSQRGQVSNVLFFCHHFFCPSHKDRTLIVADQFSVLSARPLAPSVHCKNTNGTPIDAESLPRSHTPQLRHHLTCANQLGAPPLAAVHRDQKASQYEHRQEARQAQRP